MNCPICEEKHWLIRWFFFGTTSTEMKLADWHSNYYDPSQPYGWRSMEGKAWYCKCGHTEYYEKSDPEPDIDEED